MMFVSAEAELPSEPPKAGARSLAGPARGAKIWRSQLLIWIYCNPLKSHKTAKTLGMLHLT
jgi:hypothetical protein